MEDPLSERAQPYSSTSTSTSTSTSDTSSLLAAAQFMAEDSDRRVFRRFDKLRLFQLLRLQHHLAAMDSELERRCAEQNARADRGCPDAGEDEALDGLVRDIGGVLREYDGAFWAQARFEGLRSQSAEFIHRYIQHCASKFPLLPGDLGVKGLHEEFRVAALASTAAREKSWFHRKIDKHEFWQRFFAKKSKHRHAGSVFTYSEWGIRRLERTLVHVSFCILLLCPIVALSVIQSSVGKLVVVIGFLLAVAFLTSGVLTGANNAGLAVLVGYGAILIFFLGVK